MSMSHTNRATLIFAVIITIATIIAFIANIIYTIYTSSPNIWGISIAFILTFLSLVFGIIQFSVIRREKRAAQESAEEAEAEYQKTLSSHLDQELARQIEAQKARLEKEKTQLEIERQQLELAEKRLELEKKRIEYALEAATKIVDLLQSNADQRTKEELLRTLRPSLLQIENVQGLELSPPAAQNEEEKTTNK